MPVRWAILGGEMGVVVALWLVHSEAVPLGLTFLFLSWVIGSNTRTNRLIRLIHSTRGSSGDGPDSGGVRA